MTFLKHNSHSFCLFPFLHSNPPFFMKYIAFVKYSALQMESIYPQSWSITCLYLSKCKHEQVCGKICKTDGVAAVKRRHRSPCLASTPTSSFSLPQAALPVSPCPPPTGCPARPASSRSRTRVAATANAPPQEVSPRLGARLRSTSTDRTRPPGSGDTATPPARDPPRDRRRQQQQQQLQQDHA